jgi:hypothetical protein
MAALAASKHDTKLCSARLDRRTGPAAKRLCDCLFLPACCRCCRLICLLALLCLCGPFLGWFCFPLHQQSPLPSASVPSQHHGKPASVCRWTPCDLTPPAQRHIRVLTLRLAHIQVCWLVHGTLRALPLAVSIAVRNRFLRRFGGIRRWSSDFHLVPRQRVASNELQRALYRPSSATATIAAESPFPLERKYPLITVRRHPCSGRPCAQQNQTTIAPVGSPVADLGASGCLFARPPTCQLCPTHRALSSLSPHPDSYLA